MRLYKTLGVKTLVELSSVISTADQDKMERAMRRIDEVCSNAEDNMFRDHPKLGGEYLSVFYGETFGSPRDAFDEKMIGLAKGAFDELFGGKGD